MTTSAAIYTRYSSENQRPQSIPDQRFACQSAAERLGLVVLPEHIYTDEAQSGASWDRPGLIRGFFVGEATFGYRSVAVGAVRYDKAGRARPEAYHMQVDPAEAPVVLRTFNLYASGEPVAAIVRVLNEEAVPGRIRSSKGWSTGSVTRILDNEKYHGRWVWNKRGNRRDPQTGCRSSFEKPKSEWLIHEDELLRIVPQSLWDKVRARRLEIRGIWPGGKGRRGFSSRQGGRSRAFPDHLLCGAMVCASCGRSIGLVSGKPPGYY